MAETSDLLREVNAIMPQIQDLVAMGPALLRACEIVRELAESDPTQDDAGLTYCSHCDAQENVGTPLTHLPTCLWLRARKMAGMG